MRADIARWPRACTDGREPKFTCGTSSSCRQCACATSAAQAS